MSWADDHIKHLGMGLRVSFRSKGRSMAGLIESGQEVTVEPYEGEILSVGDIVLCKVRQNQYLHLIKEVDLLEEKYLIGNNRGGINGWIPKEQIYGIKV